MSQRQAQTPVIDGFEFAKAGATLNGAWPVNDFPRLQDALESGAGSLEFEVVGARDDRNRPVLRVAVSGMLHLACQRCLAGLDFPVRVRSCLVLVATPAEIQAGTVAPDEADRVLAGKSMVVRDLLEDELLLALPDAPRHEDCVSTIEVAIGSRESPFQELRALIRGRATGTKLSKDN